MTSQRSLPRIFDSRLKNPRSAPAAGLTLCIASLILLCWICNPLLIRNPVICRYPVLGEIWLKCLLKCYPSLCRLWRKMYFLCLTCILAGVSLLFEHLLRLGLPCLQLRNTCQRRIRVVPLE